MKLFNTFCIAIYSLCFFALHGTVEYDIIPLQPADYVPTKESTYSFAGQLTESGYVIGCFGSGDYNERKAYVYHPDRGFEWIEGQDVYPEVVNERGLVAGRINGWDIFLYDANKKEMIAVYPISHFGLSEFYNFFIYNISDEGLLRVRFSDERSLIIDMNNPNNPPKEILKDIPVMNPSGNMISRTHFITASGEEIAFGSLDPYGRYDVWAQVLNTHDVVAGHGFDIQNDAVGFIWDPALGLRSFGNLGGSFVDVLAINSISQVVGVAENHKAYNLAFIFDPETGIESLGTLGGKFSTAFDINDASQVVGSSEYNKSLEDDSHAFIWDREKGMQDLNTKIAKNSGWKVLDNASEINNNGWIIGHGTYFGESKGFLLIPKSSRE